MQGGLDREVVPDMKAAGGGGDIVGRGLDPKREGVNSGAFTRSLIRIPQGSHSVIEAKALLGAAAGPQPPLYQPLTLRIQPGPPPPHTSNPVLAALIFGISYLSYHFTSVFSGMEACPCKQ